MGEKGKGREEEEEARRGEKAEQGSGEGRAWKVHARAAEELKRCEAEGKWLWLGGPAGTSRACERGSGGEWRKGWERRADGSLIINGNTVASRVKTSPSIRLVLLRNAITTHVQQKIKEKTFH